MSGAAHGEPFEVFYLPAAHGERFCIFHPAVEMPRGAIIYLHPFAEEMNKSRRMAALQSRMLAERGFAVLQVDLFGCGDSSGEFADARWEIWKQDVALAIHWVRQRVAGPIHLWGLRLGSLLALDVVRACNEPVDGVLLWQPVVSGERFLTQFLRLRLATEMIADSATRTSTQALRNELNTGVVLEIAGYDLAPELAHAIERLNLIELVPSVPVRWLEVASEGSSSLSPASRRVVDAWVGHGIRLIAGTVTGAPFWNTVEIAECPELLAETNRVLVEAP